MVICLFWAKVYLYDRILFYVMYKDTLEKYDSISITTW